MYVNSSRTLWNNALRCNGTSTRVGLAPRNGDPDGLIDTLIVQALPSTAVTHSISVPNLTSKEPGSSALVVSKGNVLEVWDLGPEGLSQTCQTEVWGVIVGLEWVGKDVSWSYHMSLFFRWASHWHTMVLIPFCRIGCTRASNLISLCKQTILLRDYSSTGATRIVSPRRLPSLSNSQVHMSSIIKAERPSSTPVW